VSDTVWMPKKSRRVVPLYYQVQQTLAARIRSGEYPPGGQLPSETELSRALSVSRVTVREALRALTDERFVVKAQGRGTFVADPLPRVPAERRFSGYLEDLYDQLPRVTVRYIKIDRVQVTDEVRGALGLPPGELTVVRVKRARSIDGSPYSFTVNLLPLALGAQLDPDVLRRVTLVRFLEDVLNVPVTSAAETFDAAAAEAEIAHWLEIPVLAPVMHVRRLLHGAAHRPLLMVDSYHRSEKLHYAVQLARVKERGRTSWAETRKKGAVGQVIKI
jgi:GntR family transcriptional regulator